MEGHKKEIRVADIKEYSKSYLSTTFKMYVDLVDVLQTVMSKQLPRERFDGINALWICLRPNAPEKEIEDALVSSHSVVSSHSIAFN